MVDVELAIIAGSVYLDKFSGSLVSSRYDQKFP